MGFLSTKRALITGVANQRSIAWGIAKAMAREGAELAFTYQSDRLKERVVKLAADLSSDFTLLCDVAEDAHIEALRDAIANRWDGVDIVVHAIAFAPRLSLQGDYLESVDRKAFQIAHDISAYSFVALAKQLRELMRGHHAAMLTLSYLGAHRAVANYNVMGPAKASLEANIRYAAAALGPEGIRVNGISAGPIKTLAATGVANFRQLLEHVEKVSPLRRNVTIDDVGNAAAFMCSDLALGITGEVLYVDAGYNRIGAVT